MTAPTDPSASPSGRARPLGLVLAGLTAATFWTVTAELLPSGLLPEMSRDLRVPESAIGALVSAWAITIAAAGIPLVRLTMRVPRAALLTTALGIVAAANLLTALAPDYALALLARVVAAAAHGLFWAVVVAYTASIVDPARLGRGLSIVLAGPTLAGLAGLPAAAALADRAGWRTVFAIVSALLALTALALRWLLPRDRREAAPAREPGAPAAARDRERRRVVLVTGAGGVVLVGHFAAFTYIVPLTLGHGGLPPGSAPVVLLLLGAAGGLGVLLAGFASDRLPRTGVVIAGGLVAAGLAMLLLGGFSPAVFLSGAAVWGLAVGAFPPLLQACVLRLAAPSFRGTAGGIIVTVLNLGVAVGAALGAVVIAWGQTQLLLVAALSTATGTAALALFSTADPVPDPVTAE
ncbi:MFS transporter [Leucobacter weissii]|uniref:MFS transporter n=1 Tax=Leucobacter weissii TaxID=1983706 RepID=A0A939MJ33_9MICO|nr:MFS transporter [Leucobacter weissii]MBO1900930.1 MFS transporter [Leucobacter weissii]